jgi:Zn-dependent protease
MTYLISHWFLSLSGALFLGLLAMVLHEAGHLITSLMVGLKVKGIGLCMKGMYVIREPGSPAKNLIVSLGGPLMNITLLVLFWHTSRTFTLANLCFAICNLLPIKGSDGDRALTCLEQMQQESAPADQNRRAA